MLQYHLNSKISFLVGGEYNLFLESSVVANGYNHLGTPFDRLSTFSLGGGLSYQINPRLNITTRYFHGISNIDHEAIYVSRIESRVIQLSLGYFYQRDEDKAYNAERKTMFSIGFRQGLSRYVLVKNEFFPNKRMEASSGRNGYQAEIDFRLTRRNFYTSIGAIYSQKGGAIDGEKEIHQNFLTIPFIVGFSPIKTKYLTVSLEGGLALNHVLSSENLPPKDYLSHSSDDIASVLYGFEVSSAAFSFSKVTPFLSYRNEVDVSSFFDGSTDEADYALSHKGQILSLGLRLKLGSASRDRTQERPGRFDYRIQIDSIVRPFSFGVKAGLNLNDTKHNQPVAGKKDHSKPYLASNFGMYLQIRLYKRLSIIPEVMYIRKGFRFDDFDGSERKAIANFLELPFIFSYQIANKIAVEAGPVVGLLLNSKFDPEFSTDFFDDYDWEYTAKGIGLETGILAGARYNLTTRFSVGARYYKGLTDISAQSSSENNEYNTNIQLFSTFRIK